MKRPSTACIALSITFLFFTVYFTPTQQHSHPEGARVRAVIVLTRHGDRSPIRTLPTSQSEWPEGAGQLTFLGMKQHFDLGKKFRERYVDAMKLLNRSYMGVHEVFVRSTAKERTLMSAQSFLMGLYPPGSSRGFPQHLIDPDWGFVGDMTADSDPKQVAHRLDDTKTDLTHWTGLPDGFQPVPVHSVGKDQDHVLYAYKNCPKLKQMSKEHKKSQIWMDKEQETAEFRTTLASVLNVSSVSLKDINSISTLLHQEQRHNKTTPTGITPQILSQLRVLQHWCLLQKYPNRDFGRLAGGHLPLVLLQTFQDIIAYERGATDKKRARFTLLSAHDGTILATMAALGIVDFVPPEFAAFIVFELLEINGEYFVYASYVDVPFKLTECADQYCTWQQFKLGLRNSYYDDWYERCREGVDLTVEEPKPKKAVKSELNLEEEDEEMGPETGNPLLAGFRVRPTVKIVKEECPAVPMPQECKPIIQERIVTAEATSSWVTRAEIEFLIGGFCAGAIFCFVAVQVRGGRGRRARNDDYKSPAHWKSPAAFGKSPKVVGKSPNVKNSKSPKTLTVPERSPDVLQKPKSSLSRASKEPLPTTPPESSRKDR